MSVPDQELGNHMMVGKNNNHMIGGKNNNNMMGGKNSNNNNNHMAGKKTDEEEVLQVNNHAKEEVLPE